LVPLKARDQLRNGILGLYVPGEDMKNMITPLIIAFMIALSLSGLSGAVTLQLTTTADISGASQDASGNYYVTEGGSFDVELTVLNPSSSSESATSVEATLSLPSGLSTTDSLTKTVSSSLSPGSSADVSWEVSGDVAGNYLGQIELTTQGTNTAQNEDSTGVLVKSPATIVGGISCSATDSKVIKSGFSLTVTVQNLGDLEATGISIVLTSDPSDISISNPETISSIDGGESGSSTYSSLSSTQATTYTFTATVTSDNAGSDTAECNAETVSSLPIGYICSSHSSCASGCCSTTCRSSSFCDDDGDGGSGGGGPTGGGGDQDKNATRRPNLVPGVGLRDNLKLQAAIQKVLGLANMSEQAKQNMLRLSESISSQIQMQRNFRYSSGTSSMETKMTYTGSQRANRFMLYDTVPKDFAEHANNISIASPGATVEIIEYDPEYLFTYDQLDPGDEITITYSVDTEVDEDVIDDFSGEVYAQELVAPPTCTEGTTQCSLNDLQVCQNGEWVIQETCQYGCSGGACNTVPPAGIDDYTLLIIIAVVVILVVAFLIFLFRKRSGPSSGPAKTEKASEPLTPTEQPYRPGTY
jgi:hypothetical protein